MASVRENEIVFCHHAKATEVTIVENKLYSQKKPSGSRRSKVQPKQSPAPIKNANFHCEPLSSLAYGVSPWHVHALPFDIARSHSVSFTLDNEASCQSKNDSNVASSSTTNTKEQTVVSLLALPVWIAHLTQYFAQELNVIKDRYVQAVDVFKKTYDPTEIGTDAYCAGMDTLTADHNREVEAFFRRKTAEMVA